MRRHASSTHDQAASCHARTHDIYQQAKISHAIKIAFITMANDGQTQQRRRQRNSSSSINKWYCGALRLACVALIIQNASAQQQQHQAESLAFLTSALSALDDGNAGIADNFYRLDEAANQQQQQQQNQQQQHYVNQLLAAAASNELGAPSATSYVAPPASLLSDVVGVASQPLISAAAAAAAAASEANSHKQPGHYAFEVAPNMEPPSVRKPPYTQSAQLCRGSDLFAGFSPRDTLCGDLNSGRVPLNPLGQFVNEQSYPFELIKNKTLQFLARALPMLKLEYETIPKVARYVPGHQLLNPTHQASPLATEHMSHLNERLYAGADPSSSSFMQATSKRRRRKRAAHSGEQQQRREHSAVGVGSISVAEMSPNATFVVSSAHSAGGRVQSANLAITARSSDQLVVDDPTQQFGVITKDGYKQVLPNGLPVARQQQQQRSATDQIVASSGHAKRASSSLSVSPTARAQARTPSAAPEDASISPFTSSSSSSGDADPLETSESQPQRAQLHVQSRRAQQQQQQQQQFTSTSSASRSPPESPQSNRRDNNIDRQQQSAQSRQDTRDSSNAATNNGGSGGGGSNGHATSTSTSTSAKRARFSCAESSSGFTST